MIHLLRFIHIRCNQWNVESSCRVLHLTFRCIAIKLPFRYNISNWLHHSLSCCLKRDCNTILIPSYEITDDRILCSSTPCTITNHMNIGCVLTKFMTVVVVLCSHCHLWAVMHVYSTATRSYSLSADDSSSEDLASRANESQPVLVPYSQIRTVKGCLHLLTKSELEGAQQQLSFVISPPATRVQLIPTRNGNRNTSDVISTSAKDECYILNIEISKLQPTYKFI